MQAGVHLLTGTCTGQRLTAILCICDTSLTISVFLMFQHPSSRALTDQTSTPSASPNTRHPAAAEHKITLKDSEVEFLAFCCE